MLIILMVAIFSCIVVYFYIMFSDMHKLNQDIKLIKDELDNEKRG